MVRVREAHGRGGMVGYEKRAAISFSGFSVQVSQGAILFQQLSDGGAAEQNHNLRVNKLDLFREP
jgi:hypothetical protein